MLNKSINFFKNANCTDPKCLYTGLFQLYIYIADLSINQYLI